MILINRAQDAFQLRFNGYPKGGIHFFFENYQPAVFQAIHCGNLRIWHNIKSSQHPTLGGFFERNPLKWQRKSGK